MTRVNGRILVGFVILLAMLLIPAASAQYFLEDFTGDAGKWLGADLEWYRGGAPAGDMLVTDSTVLDNPAADGTTQNETTVRYTHGFVGAEQDVTYVLTAKVATTAASMDWGIGFGAGASDRGNIQYSADIGGVWFFDLRGLGGTYYYIADTGGFLGSVLDVRIDLDEVNQQARAIVDSPTAHMDTGWKPFPGLSDAFGVVIYNDRRSGHSGVAIDNIGVWDPAAVPEPTPTVETPAFAPDGGSYTAAQTVTISCGTAGATIRYTTDDSVPTETNGTIIASGSSIVVDHDLTLKAKAWATDHNPSSVKTAVYSFSGPAPYFYEDFTGDAGLWLGADLEWYRGGTPAGDLQITNNTVLDNPAADGSTQNETMVRYTHGFVGAEQDVTYVLTAKVATTAASMDWGIGFGAGSVDRGNIQYSADMGGVWFFDLRGLGGTYYYIADTGGFLGSVLDVRMELDEVNQQARAIVDSPTAHMETGWKPFPGLSDAFGVVIYNDRRSGHSGVAIDNIGIYDPAAVPAPIPPAATPTFAPDAGSYTAAQTVTISCATAGATIRYTTDGSIPTETNGTVIASGSSVVVDHDMTLGARSWATGYYPSNLKSAIYTISGATELDKIPFGDAIVVDGNLADWSDAQWIALDQTYDGSPTDILNASYAAKWKEDKVYMAVKVQDNAHKFTDGYVAYNARDAVELYIHTTGTGPTGYFTTQADAQEYSVGFMPGGGSVWSIVGNMQPIPTEAGFQAAGTVNGQWLYYEAALTPFEVFSLSGQGLVVSPLSSGDVIGIDVVVAGHSGTSYTGMKSANTLGGKYNDYTKFALHLIERSISIADAKGAADGTPVTCSGVVSAVFTDFLYIESANRAYGIRVNKANHGRSVGQIVDATGAVQTLLSGERAVVADDVAPTTGTDTIAPVALNNKTLGGGQFGLQEGVAGGAGLNTIGMLVKTTGRVGTKGTGWFMIDDGSGVSLKVLGTVPTGTPYVAVTGASSCEKDGSNQLQRVIVATQVQEM